MPVPPAPVNFSSLNAVFDCPASQEHLPASQEHLPTSPECRPTSNGISGPHHWNTHPTVWIVSPKALPRIPTTVVDSL